MFHLMLGKRYKLVTRRSMKWLKERSRKERETFTPIFLLAEQRSWFWEESSVTRLACLCKVLVVINFLAKVAQMFAIFWAILKDSPFYVQAVEGTFWASFAKFGYFLFRHLVTLEVCEARNGKSNYNCWTWCRVKSWIGSESSLSFLRAAQSSGRDRCC